MAILAECPKCRRKQSAKNKICLCGQDLDKAKRSKRVKYWIGYRLPGGKQRRELVGTSIQDASVGTVPRLAAFLGALLLALPWMLTQLTNYTNRLFGDLGRFAQ